MQYVDCDLSVHGEVRAADCGTARTVVSSLTLQTRQLENSHSNNSAFALCDDDVVVDKLHCHCDERQTVAAAGIAHGHSQSSKRPWGKKRGKNERLENGKPSTVFSARCTAPCGKRGHNSNMTRTHSLLPQKTRELFLNYYAMASSCARTSDGSAVRSASTATDATAGAPIWLVVVRSATTAICRFPLVAWTRVIGQQAVNESNCYNSPRRCPIIETLHPQRQPSQT